MAIEMLFNRKKKKKSFELNLPLYIYIYLCVCTLLKEIMNKISKFSFRQIINKI